MLEGGGERLMSYKSVDKDMIAFFWFFWLYFWFCLFLSLLFGLFFFKCVQFNSLPSSFERNSIPDKICYGHDDQSVCRPSLASVSWSTSTAIFPTYIHLAFRRKVHNVCSDVPRRINY